MSILIVPDLHAPIAAWVDVYASLGWKLFPCRGKLPLLPSAHPHGDPLRGSCRGECGKEGHGLYDATDDPFQLAIWWRKYPDANIGWAMGQEFWTADVDPRAGGDDSLFQLERRYGPLPHTLLSHTGGGGSHYPFVTPPGGVINKADVGAGIDVQGEGSYIILPPSIHPDSLKPYLWDLVDGLDALQPTRAPAWLEHLVTPAAGTTKGASAAAVVVPGAPIPVGQRNNTLARMAVEMARQGASELEILTQLRLMNQRTEVPLDDAEVCTIAHGKTTAYPAHPIMLGAKPVQRPTPGTRNGAAPGWAKGQESGTPSRQLRVTALSTVRPKRVQWLWKPYLPLGRPVALEGDPGIGKSSLIARIVAHLTSGQAFPNVLPGQAPQPVPACNVCLLTAEDDAGDTILPRVVVNGGDPSRVYLIDGWHKPDGAQGPVTMQDLDLLQQALEQYAPKLLVFDPVQSFFGRRVDMNSASDTRPVLDAVVTLCKGHNCTPIFLRHIAKARRDKALYAGLGSIDITAAMRSVLFLGEDPDNEQRRIVAQSKANNAQLGPSLAYRIVSVEHDLPTSTGDLVTVDAPRIDWDGLSTLTATDLASPPVTDEEEGSALDHAKEFLRELLAEAPMLSEEVSKAAKKAGITMATIRRAKPLVGIKPRRRRLENLPSKEWPWEWYCAEAQPTGSSPSINSDEHLEHLEQLPTKSTVCEDSSRCASAHLETEPQSTENQSLALDALDAHQHTVPSAPTPAFTSFVASEIWCVTCAAPVSFRTLTQLDGTEVYRCATCDTEVGRKRTTAPPSPNGTRPPDDAPQSGQPSSGDEEEDFSDIPF